ncbi:MAG: DUF6580 family putative transport protein [Phycisphaerae bacterium]
MNRKTVIGIVGMLFLGGLCVVGRLVDHAPNFTPVLAVALFAGFLYSRRAVAVMVILAAMAISDAMIGFYPLVVMLTVYAALLFPIALRPLLRRVTAGRVLAATLFSSVVFFVSTNLAHWAFMGMYARSPEGLVHCFAAALPFFRYQIAGDFFFSSVLFGGYVLVRQFRAFGRRRPADERREVFSLHG